MKRFLASWVFFGGLTVALFAGGQNEDKGYEPVNGLKNWNQTLDLTQKKPGNYNLIIRTKDEAGNVGTMKALNVVIDPDSDLPIAAINNPLPGERIGGSLNIVGTAIDDDGVKLVEVKLDDGDWQPAKGTEFWSLVVVRNQLPEGLHTIRVRATDSNGAVGKETLVNYNLDTTKPQSSVAGRDQGSLVSGDLRLQGLISDPNGIQSFSVSSDGGKTYQSREFRYDDQQKTSVFELTIDTRRLKDGPNVWWFKSVDKTKSVGYAAFLFFVDNTSPVIEVIKPAKADKVQGRTLFVGKATDVVGVASLSYKAGRDEVAIPLTPGDPYFSAFINLPTTGDSTEVEFTAKDIAGNTVKLPYRLTVDAAGDLPVVDLRYPKDGTTIRSNDAGGLAFSGFITDDDGPAALWYSLDGAKEVRFESQESFRISLDNLSAGSHSLSFWGEDVAGAKGKPVQVKFTALTEPATIRLTTLTTGGQSAPFSLGAEIRRDARNSLAGTIVSGSPIRQAILKAGAAKETKLTLSKSNQPNQWDFSAEIPADIPYGVVNLSIETEDELQQKASFESLIYVTNYTVIHEAPGIKLDEAALGANGQVQVSRGNPLMGLVVGGEIASIDLDPPTALVKTSFSGGNFTIEAQGDGQTPETVIKVRTKGRAVFESRKLLLQVNVANDPTLTPRFVVEELVDQGGPHPFVAGGLIGDKGAKITGFVESSAPVQNASISFNGGNPSGLSLRNEGGTVRFVAELPAGLGYDRVSFRLSAEDNTKQRGEYSSFVFKIDASFAGTITDQNGIYSAPNGSQGNRWSLRRDDQVALLFKGRPIAEANLVPVSNLLQVRFEGAKVFVNAIQDGSVQKVKVRAKTVDGDEFLSPELEIRVDGQAAKATIDSPKTSQWLGKSLQLRVALEDNVGLTKAELVMDQESDWRGLRIQAGKLPPAPSSSPAPAATASPAPGAAKPGPSPAPARPTVAPAVPPRASAAPAPQAPKPTTRPGGQAAPSVPGTGSGTAGTGPEPKVYFIDEKIDISNLADGGHNLTLKLTDSSELVTYAYLGFEKNSAVPTMTFITPVEGEKVNGLISLTAHVTAGAPVSALAWSADGKTFTNLEATRDLAQPLDLSKIKPVPQALTYRVTDLAGNTADIPVKIAVDAEADKPVVQIQLPIENDVQRQDFVISGIALDDDGVAKILYRLDGAKEWSELPGAANFSIPLALTTIGDNEHLVEVKGVDTNGVEGNVQSRKFRVSTEEPIGTLASPSIDLTNRGVITLAGTASDKNGVKEVWVSVDNGNTFGRATGTEKWSYPLDTRVLQDGTYAIQFKFIDKYDTEGLQASIINIDNTAPRVSLDKPFDGQGLNSKLILDGRTSDNIQLAGVGYVLTRLGADKQPVAEVSRKPVTTNGIFVEEVDVAGLEPGWYNIRVEAKDKANNQGFSARNFQVLAEAIADQIDILYPLPGEAVSGLFNLEGRVVAKSRVETVKLTIDGETTDDIPVNKRGYFHLLVGPGKFRNGTNTIQLSGAVGSTGLVKSESRPLVYQQEGPWIVVDELVSGDYLRNRPYLKGKAGWNLWPLTEEQKKDEAVRRARDELIDQTRVNFVEISFDNGKTFQRVDGQGGWQYRLESLTLPDGPLYYLIRATFRNGVTAIARQVLTLDQTEPVIGLLEPQEGGRFNQKMVLKGTASDNFALESVEVNLREGDKAAYEIPGFIQGMFLDFRAYGFYPDLSGLTWEGGIGFSFFDRNVKLEAMFGSTPNNANLQYSGYILSAKLLANVVKIPFASIFGPDLDFLQTSLALGAKFSYFTQSPGQLVFDKGTTLASFLAHWEVVRFNLKTPVLNSIALYSEFEVWLTQTQVNKEVTLRLAFGTSVDLL